MAKIPLWRRGCLGTAAFLAATLFGSPVFADGGPPAAYGILFEPGNPSHIVIRSRYWGLFDGHPGANTWSLLCSQAFGGRATTEEEFPTVLARGGRILVASGFGGINISDDECSWRKSDAFDPQTQVVSIARVDAAGTGFITVTAHGTNGGTTSRAFVSSDRGDTWMQTKGQLLADFSVMDVAVAPSDRSRFYVVGVMVNGGPRKIGTSTDAGASWMMLPLASPDQYSAGSSAPLSIVGVDPAHPETLFVRANGTDYTPVVPDELWASADAGKTWVKAYAPIGDLNGFTFSPDGKKVFIGGIADGIQVASLEDAIAGKPEAFRAVYTGKVWGLATNDGKLYAGTDDFAMKPPFLLGVSTDEGTTFSPVMNHCQVSFPACAPSSSMETLCREQWERVGGYVTDLLDNGCSDRSTGGTPGSGGGAGNVGVGGAPSGGAEPAPVASASASCSMRPARSPTSFPTIILVAAAVAGVEFRRARKRLR